MTKWASCRRCLLEWKLMMRKGRAAYSSTVWASWCEAPWSSLWSVFLSQYGGIVVAAHCCPFSHTQVLFRPVPSTPPVHWELYCGHFSAPHVCLISSLVLVSTSSALPSTAWPHHFKLVLYILHLVPAFSPAQPDLPVFGVDCLVCGFLFWTCCFTWRLLWTQCPLWAESHKTRDVEVTNKVLAHSLAKHLLPLTKELNSKCGFQLFNNSCNDWLPTPLSPSVHGLHRLDEGRYWSQISRHIHGLKPLHLSAILNHLPSKP